MKQGWEIKKLSEICVSSNGLWKGKNPPFTTIAVLRSTNFTKDCKIKLDDVAYIEVEEKSFAKRRLQKNDIVVERSGGGPNQPVGRVLLFDIEDENYSFCNFTSALRVLDTTIVSPIYLHRYLTYFYLSGQTINIQSNTIGLRNLDYTKYLEISIPVPPIAEQERIVEILDREFEKIDALKANAERNLQYAKDLYAKLTDHILTPQEGWSTSNLKSICKKIGSGATPSGGKQSYTDKGIHLIRSMNVHNNCFRYNELAHINDVQAKQLDNVTIERGDVLFNITGASVTRCCLVPVDVIPARVNQHVSILRVDDNIILPKYLVYTLISSRYNVPLMQMAEDGATRQAITKKQLEDFNISYPNTIKEQLNIISFLDKLSEQCKALGENYTNTIALCDDMKQALLRQAFNGEL